jgi:hypothetical protein
MKVRFLRDWHEIDKGTVQDLSEFDIIRLKDLGIIEKVNGSRQKGITRTSTTHIHIPAQPENQVQSQPSHLGG